MRKIIYLFLFFLLPFFVPTTFAKENSFVSIINPIRGSDFWEEKSQNSETAVLGQIKVLDKFNLPATWLLRFDALNNKQIIDVLKDKSADEKGLFLEITPSWTNEANVNYRKSASWHSAGSAFLTGYERGEREKLIDSAFEKFKSKFSVYPVSVGAWWIDSFSLDYMQRKYGVSSALIVADQYSTDNYQIWGQYFGTPYYPAKNNALHPAQSLENKLNIIMVQWATRDPVNGYGNGVIESTFSVQANDYIDYHNLDINYFSSLIDIYTKQKFNQFGHLVVGLENSYSWDKYSKEYEKQVKVLSEKKKNKEIFVVSMENFAKWYKSTFPKLSPEHLIISDDPLGSFKKVVWFMNPYYRVGWFVNSDGSVFRDIRQYIDGEEELCFRSRCDNVNFATSATRVLDEVSFGHKWIIDQGKITNFKFTQEGDKFIITYNNEAGNLRRIELLPRDLNVDGKISSIDVAILNAIRQENTEPKDNITLDTKIKWSLMSVLTKLGKFLIFLVFALIIPGWVLIQKLNLSNRHILVKLFLSSIAGIVILTLIFYISSLLKIRFIVFVYLILSLILFIKNYKDKKLPNILSLKENLYLKIKQLINLLPATVILLGTIFQAIPTFKSGLNFAYGLGFWGPNTHDGIWHISLINQLIQSVPAQNPIFASSFLKNYHFFYDLLVAATAYFTKLPVIDLVFRFYPALFSLLLGIGTYYLVLVLFAGRIGESRAKIGAILSLYFVYFAGSFGWIVEYLKQGTLGGESAFWANQSISFNLNPPFAISLLIIIAILYTLNIKKANVYGIVLSVILISSLIGFKSYGSVLIISTLAIVAVVNLIKKNYTYLYIFATSLFFSLLIFLTNFRVNKGLIEFVPFWFIHSMIDAPDRVGWTRLSLTRTVGFETENWLKFFGAEIISLLLFIFGNLGMRFISIFSLFRVKEIIRNNNFLFLFIMTVFSFFIPVLFIQSGNPWNTIQFSYYGLYITALISGVLLVYLRLTRFLSVLIIGIVLVVTPINAVTTATYYLNSPHALIDSKELEALNFLSKQKEGIVLTPPYNEKLKTTLAQPWPLFAYSSTAYVSALSKKAVFLEDEGQNQILLTDYKKRLVAENDFFSKSYSKGNQFLRENNIKYIYIPKDYKIYLEDSVDLEVLFENQRVVIYKVI